MKQKDNMNQTKDIPVLVTTAHRGVFFGYVDKKSIGQDTLYVRQARCCIYWPNVNRGFLGLSNMGPLAGSKIGPPANVTLFNVTSVSEVTTAAEAKWNSFA